MDQPDIELMARALSYLNAMPTSSQNSEYAKIIESIDNYLKNNCKHDIIEDDIDTAPESSKTIFYCKHCLQTFMEK